MTLQEDAMRICALQMDVKAGDRAANHATVQRLVDKAVSLCAPDVIVLPELWSTGYALEQAATLADEQGDADFLRALAQKNRLAFAGGSVLARHDGGVTNRAQVIDSKGHYLAFYDKVHLFRLMDEDTFLAPGRQVSLFELHGMPCSSVICYDIRFCELPRRLAVQGAELLFVSAEWPSPRAEHWRTLLRARAIENQIFVAACNRCGVTDGTVFAGRSAIIAPDGSVLAEAGTEEEIIWTDIDAAAVRHMRDLIPVFEDRVPGMY